MSRVKIFLCCLICLMVAGIGLVGYQRLREEPRAFLSVLPEKKEVSLNHIHHVATRDGVKEWTLDAGSAQYEKGDGKAVFKDIVATFFLDDSKTIQLNGAEAVLLSNTSDMEIWGDVVVQSGRYEFNTENLRYEHKTRTISTETSIVIKGNGMEIRGDSMIFNLQTEQVVVCGRVKAVLEGLKIED
ncbi:MAG: LPS export ABC transporter periplasmic protein LptC [Desulfobacterales bacterium]|nr:LPS export ABC transporter periplasmic protein LptC [Desulfobacterales bacterium]